MLDFLLLADEREGRVGRGSRLLGRLGPISKAVAFLFICLFSSFTLFADDHCIPSDR